MASVHDSHPSNYLRVVNDHLFDRIIRNGRRQEALLWQQISNGLVGWMARAARQHDICAEEVVSKALFEGQMERQLVAAVVE